MWNVRTVNDGKSVCANDRQQDFPILPWKLKWREYFLRESIRLDGRAEVLNMKTCPGCQKDGFPEYRCEDCRGADLCKECTLTWHRYSPLHKIEVFVGLPANRCLY